MIKTFFLGDGSYTSGIDLESVNELIESIEAYIDGIDGIRLYINSLGGEVPEAMKLVDYINNFDDFLYREIVITDLCGSAVLLFCLCVDAEKKKVLPSASGMFHLLDHKLNIEKTRYPYSMESFMQDKLYFSNGRVIELAKNIGLSDYRVSLLREGKDIWLNTEELQEILDKSQHKDLYNILF